MFHYLSGNIGERDPEFCYPNVHPDLQSWGTLTLNAPIDASATSFDGGAGRRCGNAGDRHGYPDLRPAGCFQRFYL